MACRTCSSAAGLWEGDERAFDLFIVCLHDFKSSSLEMSHSTDSEPHASPGLPECEHRNPKVTIILITPSAVLITIYSCQLECVCCSSTTFFSTIHVHMYRRPCDNQYRGPIASVCVMVMAIIIIIIIFVFMQ